MITLALIVLGLFLFAPALEHLTRSRPPRLPPQPPAAPLPKRRISAAVERMCDANP